MNLGQQIRKLRAQLGLTLEQLAQRSGVDVGTISALEVRESTRSKYAQQIATGLGVSLDELLSGRQVTVFQTQQSAEDQWVLRLWHTANPEDREVARLVLSDNSAPMPAWADKDMRLYVISMRYAALNWLRSREDHDQQHKKTGT